MKHAEIETMQNAERSILKQVKEGDFCNAG